MSLPVVKGANTDRRHLDMIYGTIVGAGGVGRYLEIGSHSGFSAHAPLAACQKGLVGEVHLCEPRVRPELIEVVRRYNLGDKVRVHSCESLDLLSRDRNWDAVFVDGDHSEENCAEESKLLLDAGTGLVFIHDVAPAAHSRYDTPTGPARMREAFEADGRYRCVTDSAYRHGERTERGLTCAVRDARFRTSAARTFDLLGRGNGTLAVLTCRFNPVGFQRPADNFRRFFDQMRGTPGVSPFSVEVLWGDQQPIEPESVVIRAEDRHVMWQKERLLNLLCASLPERFEYVAWVDGDILFADRDWPAKTIEALQEHDVVQPWDTAYLTDQAGAIAVTLRSLASGGTQPGYAWAARRSVFPLWDGAVIGGGDCFAAATWGLLPGFPDPTGKQYTSEAWLESWGRYRLTQPARSVGSVAGGITHLWHGEYADRRYRERTGLFPDMDPARDLAADPASGLWAWTDPERARVARDYFAERREDGDRQDG